jgi:ribosomal protein S18 acetylase RimI-like enzyme
MLNGNIFISDDKSKLDIHLIYQFLSKESHWAKGISKETVEKAIRNSLCFGLYFQEQQIGFTRFITDEATFAYLCDVFVLKEFRNRGYAELMLEESLRSNQLKNLRRIVLVTSDAHKLYKKLNFRSLSKPDTYMEQFDPDVYSTGN